MGVRGLWGIMRPGMRQIPVSQLTGQRLAVDLSIWVVEVVNTQMHGVVTKPHLRNIFFRVAKLLELNVQLIFCVEGEAPALKAQVMAERNVDRFGAKAAGSESKTAKNTSRSRFRSTLKECTDLLDILGVPWIQSPGEAEAACAMLNQLGIVDGVITEDGDAFLYGAKRVYKNFGCDAKKDLLIDVYEDRYIYETLALNQEKLIALGLFLGCDYFPDGIKGIGRSTSIKVMAAWPRHGCFARLKMWKTRSQSVVEDYLTKCEAVDCRSDCGKTWNSLGKDILRLESQMVKKVESYRGFPDMRVAREFLQVDFPRKKFFEDFGSILSERPWPCPNADRFVTWANAKMEWVVNYAVAKILPLVTLWKIRNLSTTSLLRMKDPRFTDPLRIVKKRIRQGNPVFEVEWSRFQFHSEEEEDQDGDETAKLIYNTMEPEGSFRKAYPQLCAQYDEREEGKKKPVPKGKKKAKTPKAAESQKEDGDNVVSIEKAMQLMRLKGKDEDEPTDILSPGRPNDFGHEMGFEKEKENEGTFDDLIKEIDNERRSNSKKLTRPGVEKRSHQPFTISSSESEDEWVLSRPPPNVHNPVINRITGEDRRRMSFMQLKELEDSINVELERQIESNQSIRRDREDDEAVDDAVDIEETSEFSEENNLHLTFNLSYGNFSLQASLDESKTPLRSLENVASSRWSHSTPLLMPLNGSQTTSVDYSPEGENYSGKPVFDPDSSLDSPLPLRERLKRGLL